MSSNKMTMNILGIKPWEMLDEKSGEVRRGASVFVGQEPDDPNSGILGWAVMKFSVSIDVYEKAKYLKMEFPGEFPVDVSLKLGAAGKGQLNILGIG